MAPRLSACLKSPGEARTDSTAKRKRALLESFRDTLRNQEIAERLKLSVSTVNACLRKLYEEHNVRDRVGLLLATRLAGPASLHGRHHTLTRQTSPRRFVRC